MIDITHGIGPQQVVQGALVLANTLPYLPQGVHVAVVDPGVGGERKALVLQGDARVYVGPDNGVLLVAADKLGGLERAVSIENADYLLHPVSQTFHGRDVFSPVAAHLALGVPVDAFGPDVDVARLRRLDLPTPEIGSLQIRLTALYVDRYGNVQVNATSEDLERAGIGPGTRVGVEVRSQSYPAVTATTFTDVQTGEMLLYEDAYGNAAVAINGGDAAELLSLQAGGELRIRLARE